MHKDRAAISTIISEMLDNPENGIYPTSTCYMKLEHYIEQVRAEAIGRAHINACKTLDKGIDSRSSDVTDILFRANRDLSK